MWPLIRNALVSFWKDPLFAKRALRGAWLGLAGLAATIVPSLIPEGGWAAVQGWSGREWLGRLMVAAMFTVPGFISANSHRTPEQTAADLESIGALPNSKPGLAAAAVVQLQPPGQQ